MSEQRFGLIVRCVGHGDSVRLPLLNNPLEKCVAEPPSGFLEIPPIPFSRGGNILAVENESQSEAARQIGYEFSVGIRFRAP
jgi:hypothetical protein